MGAPYERHGNFGEGGATSSSSPSSEDSVPDFRALLRRAAADLRAEAGTAARADHRERLLKLAEMLDRYADESDT
jgi:hypothetical protein